MEGSDMAYGDVSEEFRSLKSDLQKAANHSFEIRAIIINFKKEADKSQKYSQLLWSAICAIWYNIGTTNKKGLNRNWLSP